MASHSLPTLLQPGFCLHCYWTPLHLQWPCCPVLMHSTVSTVGPSLLPESLWILDFHWFSFLNAFQSLMSIGSPSWSPSNPWFPLVSSVFVFLLLPLVHLFCPLHQHLFLLSFAKVWCLPEFWQSPFFFCRVKSSLWGNHCQMASNSPFPAGPLSWNLNYLSAFQTADDSNPTRQK